MKFSQRKSGDRSGIDMAPIVDVIFNLLIFFALTLNFAISSGIKVNLPKATGEIVEIKDVNIHIDKDGKVYFNDTLMRSANSSKTGVSEDTQQRHPGNNKGGFRGHARPGGKHHGPSENPGVLENSNRSRAEAIKLHRNRPPATQRPDTVTNKVELDTRRFTSLNDLITRFFILWIILFSAVAFFFPSVFEDLGFLIVPMLAVIMFAMGMTLKINDFRRVFLRPLEILVGICAQYVVMPLLGFLLAIGFGINPLIAVGIVLVGSCPGGTASNVITYLARGDLALSVNAHFGFNASLPVSAARADVCLRGKMDRCSGRGTFLSPRFR